MRENKKCWACGKSLTGGEKLGLCDGCLNKYGTPAAAVAALGIGIGAKFFIKNGGKIVKNGNMRHVISVLTLKRGK